MLGSLILYREYISNAGLESKPHHSIAATPLTWIGNLKMLFFVAKFLKRIDAVELPEDDGRDE